MTDDELLDKVCEVTDKWSKQILATIGGYLLSILIIAWNVNGWVVANTRENLGALVAFGIGGILTGAVIASLFWRYVVRRALKAKDDECKKKLEEKDTEIQKVVEDHTASFLDLQARQLSAIFYCVARGGTVSIPSDSELARELQALKRMGYADTPDGSGQGSYWFVTDGTMNIIRNSEECSALLDEAALVGRFSDDGRYIVTAPDVADFVRSKLKEE